MRTRADWEALENETLAPYAQKSAQSRGRKHKEPEHPFRSCYQRDRDRIVHSRAFRRLEYKTQVFVNDEGDHYRTRLTHSMEAASIARTLARALRLNEDLAETIALAHDLGHPPFGHSGEQGLHRMMQGAGGFEHNKQSLRVVEALERKYPHFAGLNLTWEVREGISKHRLAYEAEAIRELDLKASPSLEAQLVDKADEIAYNCHDMDDGLASGLLTMKQLQQIALWQEAYGQARRGLSRRADAEVIRYFAVRAAVNALVTDLAQNTEANILKSGVRNAEEVRRRKGLLAGFSKDMLQKHTELKRFLFRNLYSHPDVTRMNKLAVQIVQELFAHYLQHREDLHASTRSKTRHTPLKRVICDYIAGMTDRFAMQEHLRLVGVRAKG